jgi:cation transport protein ChaC
MTTRPAATTDAIAPELIVRDPQAALQRLREQWPSSGERWVFGYASLIWRPEFDAAEHRSARVHGWHRALRMR